MSDELKAIQGKDGIFAIMKTTSGSIVLELFYKETPLTVTNFVGLAEGTLDAAKGKPFYDGLTFHRVIADFMIQGGDPKGNGTGGPGYKFADEFVDNLIFDKPGLLAMANSGPNTNGSQFFITHVPTDWLNHKHTIFGKVVN
ncbi:MAG: peptidylprolyl isomerase, partial [Treponema sp.]|nr:peptidylprolyl isomerase [Treponema sp.]